MTDHDDPLKMLEEQLTKPPPLPTKGFIVVRPLPGSDEISDDERMDQKLRQAARMMGATFIAMGGSTDVAAAVVYRVGGQISGQEPEDFEEHGIVYYQKANAVEIRDGYHCLPQGRVLCYDPPPGQ